MEADLRGSGDESPALELTSGPENWAIRWSLQGMLGMQKAEQVRVEKMMGYV